MTVEERHAANDWISKIHNQIHRAPIGYIHGIEPFWIVHWILADGIYQEMNLMYVKWMHLSGWVRYTPVLQRTDIDCQHRAGIHVEFLAIYIEALFVFSESDNELRFTSFHAFKNCRREGCVDRCSAKRRASVRTWWLRRHDIGQDHGGIGISIRTGIEAARAQRSMRIRSCSGDNCFHSPG